jgi:hypothetical protein
MAEGLANLRFEAVDAGPSGVLDGMRAALRPGGSLLLAESAVSGDPMTDAADPTSPIIYGCEVLYCYQESKLPGRPEMGASWPARGLGAMLAGHGLAEARRVESQAGYVVIRAVPLRT